MWARIFGVWAVMGIHSHWACADESTQNTPPWQPVAQRTEQRLTYFDATLHRAPTAKASFDLVIPNESCNDCVFIIDALPKYLAECVAGADHECDIFVSYWGIAGARTRHDSLTLESTPSRNSLLPELFECNPAVFNYRHVLAKTNNSNVDSMQFSQTVTGVRRLYRCDKNDPYVLFGSCVLGGEFSNWPNPWTYPNAEDQWFYSPYSR